MAYSKFEIWWEAARPRTLAAAFVPVVIGASIAYYDGNLDIGITFVALIAATLIQIGTNFANDYFDNETGADNDERIGFTRVTSQGLVEPGIMLAATIGTMGAAFLVGLYLVWHAGWVILVIGLLAIFMGLAYTGGPFPLGYNGLGDIFVFIFFGIIAVMATYYVNALHWSVDSFWASLAVGALSTSILIVNNIRDIEQDKIAGKRTIGVLLGENALRWEYTIMMILAFAIPPHMYYRLDYTWPILLPLASLPLGALLVQRIWTVEEKARFNVFLERTAQFMTLYGILFALGVILSRIFGA